MCRHVVCLTLLLVALPQFVSGDEPAHKPSQASVRTAIERGLKVLGKAARNYPEHRQCFSCHHQTLPLLAMREAKKSGFAIESELFDSQIQFTRISFSGLKDALESGSGIGGRSMTVAYGLWTLDIGRQSPDELTQALVTFLLKNQRDDGSWRPPSHRPPLEESEVACTVLAAYRLVKYASDDQKSEARQAVERATAWLGRAELGSQEDRNFRLWGLSLLDGDATQIAAARRDVLNAQRDGGGWSQLPDMDSDAYATGQALYALGETGGSEPDAPDGAVLRGVRFLLETQDEDGSWMVKTRSKPVQVFFDNGDPHGESQFISIAATGWAVAALAKSLDQVEVSVTASSE